MKTIIVEHCKVLLYPKDVHTKVLEITNYRRSVGNNLDMVHDTEKNSLFHSTLFFITLSKNIIALHHLETHDMRILFNFWKGKKHHQGSISYDD